MRLKQVVTENRILTECWKPGIKALRKRDKKLISAKDKVCSGGIDIDTCLYSLCPGANRWDYGLEVGDKAIFIEVHSAHTNEVKVVVAKLNWLCSWFAEHCTGFNALRKSFYWIASGTVAIQKGSPQARYLAQAGISGPVKHLNLASG